MSLVTLTVNKLGTEDCVLIFDMLLESLGLQFICILCLKETCDNLIGCSPILPILGRNTAEEIGNKRIYTAFHISILCVCSVPCKNIFF